MYLEELFNYKNQLMEDLLSNEKIVALLTDSDEIRANPSLLAYTQVFPYEYIEETIEHGKTVICYDVDISRATSKTFLLPTIYIWVFTHSSRLRLPEGGIRTDALCAEIAKTINGSKHYGLGELELYAVKRYAPLQDFQGKLMTFDAVEINRLSPTGKSAPNKRRGF